MQVNSFKGACLRKAILEFLETFSHHLDEALFAEQIISSLQEPHPGPCTARANRLTKRWKSYPWQYNELRACSFAAIQSAQALALRT